MIKVLYIPLLAVASGLLIVVLQKLVIQHAYRLFKGLPINDGASLAYNMAT